MADLAQPSINAGSRSFLARWDRRFHSLQSRVARYGLAIVSVTVALGLSLALQYYQFRGVEVPVLTLAIAVTTWYAGNGPAVVAIILSSLCFDYFFTEPYYSLEITSRDLPYFFIFVIWGLIVAAFSAVRRHVEEGLRQAQEELAKRAVELHAINSMLTHEINQPCKL
jgi:K+-sensing histidine kinase KdpD